MAVCYLFELEGTDVTCAIWRTPADAIPSTGDYAEFASPSAGGKYRVAGGTQIHNLDPKMRARLTNWLLARRALGEPSPMITSSVLAQVQNSPDLTVGLRRDKALSFLASQSPNLGANLRFAGLEDQEYKDNVHWLIVHTESSNLNEARAFLDFLEQDGLVLKTGQGIRVTFKGWSYLESNRSAPPSSHQVFVAMWFSGELTDAYTAGIEPAIRATGHSAMRIDQKEHANKIDDEIIAEIRRSRFVVADFTSERDRARGGVYFEAGFAIGLNKPVIWTCRQDLIDQVHFDTRQFNHITWNSPADLKTKLINRIVAVVGDGPLPKQN